MPQRGNKRELVQLAAQTATEKLGILRAQWESDTVKQETALREIQEALNLPNPPNRIECYDISTTQGTAIVASRVVFVQGVPRKSRIPPLQYPHGGARRLGRLPVDARGADAALPALCRSDENPTAADPGKKDHDETWRLLPDLLIVDGGKGQLGVACEVLQEFS